jgi:hypothetical protein
MFEEKQSNGAGQTDFGAEAVAIPAFSTAQGTGCYPELNF